MIDAASLPASPRSARLTLVCERAIAGCLILYALFAPHSIALTQGAALVGMLFWAILLFANRSIRHLRTPLDLAVFGFFSLCVVSSFFSYDPLVSLKGLRSPAFFLVFYYVSSSILSLKLARILPLIIIGSCLINIGYSALQLQKGRGLHIDQIERGSPLSREELRVGDVILEADGKRVDRLEDLSEAVDANRGPLRVKIQRNEATVDIIVSRKAIRRAEGEGTDRLALETSKGRRFRVSGFYSHYETYAEVLQLIGALAIGLLISQRKKLAGKTIFLGISAVLIAGTLALTSTRAAIGGLALAVVVMAFFSIRPRTFLYITTGLILFGAVSYLAIERVRGPMIFSLEEGSTEYRLEVWQEAFRLISDHPVFGIGKGSEGTRELKDQYGLYAEGKLPPGHFHSTPIQIATWWGLPALACYIAMMTILAREFIRLSRRLRSKGMFEEWGIALGGIGILTAFNVSSLVHFNFGDGEVVMMFWLTTGLVFSLRRLAADSIVSPALPPGLGSKSTEESHRNPFQEPETSAESSARVARARQHS